MIHPTNLTDLHFVVCVRNEGYAAALEVRKLYPLLSDAAAATLHYVRIIDESGEDYLYPEDYFIAVELPQAVKDVLLRIA